MGGFKKKRIVRDVEEIKACRRQVELEDLNAGQIRKYLSQAPRHLGNTIVGEDQWRVRALDPSEAGEVHTALLVLENVTILPLQICIVTVVARRSGKLDIETFRSKAIADVVIVWHLLRLSWA